MAERIFEPLGMRDVGFFLTESLAERRVAIHSRGENGAITVLPDLAPHQLPEMDCGGHGLYGAVGEFMKFIRMVLNDGAGSHGRVLKPATVNAMCEDGLADIGLSAGGWSGAIPSVANTDEFFPGIAKGWGYTFMINREATPTGRPAGSLAWAGLANTFFWIDRASGIGGYWATGMLPFLDAVSYPGFLEFESTVYLHRRV
jgi:methyl acetate hydrolase